MSRERNEMLTNPNRTLRSFTMKSLTIKDLARNEQLDGKAMAAVRGGWSMNSPHYELGDITYAPSYDSSITASQSLVQVQNVTNAVANGSAFVDGVHATNNTTQFGQNNIFGSGSAA
jgi:hypothetical protein